MRFRVIATVAAVVGVGLGLAPIASAYEYGPVYATCGAAAKAGVYDISQTSPAYWPDGDSDGDGVACESPNN